MLIKDINSEVIELCFSYKHEYATIEHLTYVLLKNDEVTEIIKRFNLLDLNKLKEVNKNFLEDIEPSRKFEEVMFGLDYQSAMKFAAINSGSSFSVTYLDVVSGVISNVIQNMEDGINSSTISDVTDIVTLGKFFDHLTNNHKSTSPYAIDDGSYNLDSKIMSVSRSGQSRDSSCKLQNPKEHNFIGLNDEVEKVIRVLNQKHNTMVVISGDTGTGKTKLIQEVINRVSLPEHATHLSGMRFVKVNSLSIISSLQYKGATEQMIIHALDSAKKDNCVLIIEDFHLYMDNAQDIPLIPIITRATNNGVKVICSVQDKSYAKVFEKKPYSDLFTHISMPDQNKEDTIKIIDGELNSYREHFGVTMDTEFIEDVVNLSERHLSGNQPDKSLRLLNRSFTLAMLKSSNSTVDKNIIIEAIADIKNITIEEVCMTETEKLSSIEASLKGSIFGQDEAVDTISQSIMLSKLGFKEDPNKTNGNFMLLGPTGVGKTELCRKLAEIMSVPIIRIDMSEFKESHTVSKLLGAPAGYVGHNDGDGMLYDKIVKNPQSIILFDEIEKAHPSIFDLFLGVMDNGTLTTSTNKTIDFRDSLIFYTSNVGAQSLEKGGFGFSSENDNDNKISINKEEFNNMFKPEFRNRLDHVVYFNTLSQSDALDIVNKIYHEVAARLKEDRDINLSVTEEALLEVVNRHFNKAMGARPLRRGFKQDISNEVMKGLIVKSDKKDFKVTFKKDSFVIN